MPTIEGKRSCKLVGVKDARKLYGSMGGLVVLYGEETIGDDRWWDMKQVLAIIVVFPSVML